jgi:decaprenylphospho-beta-D-erythro-pentofuranosid-2-ulose 2-reductase
MDGNSDACRVLILGATSAIAEETAKHFAKRRGRLCLVGRNTLKLRAIANDLRVRGAAQVEVISCDLNDLAQHRNLITQADRVLGGLDAALIAYGVLPRQESCEHDLSATLASFQTNCVSAISLLSLLADYFEERRNGLIAVITSVAGDRGRRSNYIYGSAKAALNVFLEGLHVRLRPANVSVLTIKPGFVRTPMTAHMRQNFLFADPRRVGSSIYRAVMSKKRLIYVPWFWRYIMMAVRLLPH